LFQFRLILVVQTATKTDAGNDVSSWRHCGRRRRRCSNRRRNCRMT